MMLADHGAEVIRIDRPGGVQAGLGGDGSKEILNRSRLSLAVDLKRAAGVVLVRALCRSADGLIEGFRPNVMERLGLGPVPLLAENKRLVYGRITGWGQTGPYAQKAGHDINYIALSGNLHGYGRAGDKPTPPANAVLFAEDYSFFFNVLGPRPGVTMPPPNGSIGAPAHLNDYDEVWFKHASEMSPESVGDLWNLPRTITHPGLRGPAEHPPNPPRQVQEMNINFDTKAKLRWTETARATWFPDPQVKLYTSLYGAHVGVVPEVATTLAERSKQ